MQTHSNVPRQLKISIVPLVVITASGLTGGASLLLFFAFLYTGLPGQIDLGLGKQSNLILDAVLCLLFFMQHSTMIRSRFRKWLAGVVDESYLGATFSIFSGICLWLLMIFWQKSDSIHIQLDSVAYWIMNILFIFSIAGFWLTSRVLKNLDTFGIKSTISKMNEEPVIKPRFTVTGPYHWVRHPFYSFTLLMIWVPTNITDDRLLFNALWTIWTIIGAHLEERDLIDSFGGRYREYKSKVPMLIPYRIFSSLSKGSGVGLKTD